VYFGDAFVPYSFEVGQDATNFLDELRKVLVDGADQLMNTAYTLGTGSGQPTGIVIAIVGTASEVNAADDTFAKAMCTTFSRSFQPASSRMGGEGSTLHPGPGAPLDDELTPPGSPGPGQLRRASRRRWRRITPKPNQTSAPSRIMTMANSHKGQSKLHNRKSIVTSSVFWNTTISTRPTPVREAIAAPLSGTFGLGAAALVLLGGGCSTIKRCCQGHRGDRQLN
jgi:hypothetical protein